MVSGSRPQRVSTGAATVDRSVATASSSPAPDSFHGRSRNTRTTRPSWVTVIVDDVALTVRAKAGNTCATFGTGGAADEGTTKLTVLPRAACADTRLTGSGMYSMRAVDPLGIEPDSSGVTDPAVLSIV